MATIRYLVADVDRSVAFRNPIVVGPGGKQILADYADGNSIELFEARR
jgi:hypothetical protein